MSTWEQIFLALGIGFAAFLGAIVWFLFRCWQAERDTQKRCEGEDRDVVSYSYDDVLEYARAHDEIEANGWRLVGVTPRTPGTSTITATFRRVK